MQVFDWAILNSIKNVILPNLLFKHQVTQTIIHLNTNHIQTISISRCRFISLALTYQSAAILEYFVDNIMDITYLLLGM